MKRTVTLATGAALALALALGGAQAQDKKADKQSQSFIKDAIEANYSEINLGKLAQEKAKSDSVKQYGAMMVKDHSAANEKAKSVAQQLGVEPPSGSSVMEKGSYLKLKVLLGETFDRSFVNTMVSDHKAVIKEFQKESTKTDAAGQFAKDTLPTLQHHLQEAETLHRQMQTTGSK